MHNITVGRRQLGGSNTSFSPKPTKLQDVGRIMRICKIEGCENKHKAKGLCRKHYLRLWKHGDPFFKKAEKHGMKDTSEYYAWARIKQRCYNSNYHLYRRYGGRGIMVCDKWKNSFIAFFKDMGPKPFPKAQIDRIDNNKGYYKENCHWATATENGRNRECVKLNMQKAKEIRESYKTRNITYKKLSLIYGVDFSTIGNVITYKTWKDNQIEAQHG